MRASIKNTALAILLGTALAVPALAQPAGAPLSEYPVCPDPPPKLTAAQENAAHAAFTLGNDAFQVSDYPKAIELFKDAYKRDCSKQILLDYIARAYEAKGEKGEAINALETYLKRNPKADDADQVRTRIENLKAALAAQTATATAPTSTGTAPAGTGTATAPTATATSTAPVPPPTGGHTVAPWIVTGAGGALTVVGVVLLIVGQGKVSASKAGCPNNDPSKCASPLTADGKNRQDLNNSGTTLSNVGLVTGVVGVAAVGGGLLWHFLEPTDPKPTAARLTPEVSPGYAGLSFAGAF
jgi:tetratricopeptide (TPR) repeat protein